MPRALIIGGTSAVGRSTAHRLLSAGWGVDLAGRNPARMPAGLAAAGARFVQADRADADQLRAAYGAGADLLVDNVCYTAAHAREVLPYARDAGSVVMISSKAVYVDAAGNHPNSEVAPRFDGPIIESQATMAPSDIDFNSREGYGANKVAAERILLDSGVPVTIIRPSKVHGPGALRPREWTFVKRVLDRRPVVLLAHGGRGGDHPTAAANIAALIEVAAARPGQRILNSADPDTPSAAEIARIVAGQLGHRWKEVLLDDTAPRGLGETPWDLRHPIVLDTSAAQRLGYTPAGDYASTVAAEVEWLVAAAQERAGADTVPADDDTFFARLLDYAAEDAYLAARA
jgi:nucleoside-diphosphate-sugar epimerase